MKTIFTILFFATISLTVFAQTTSNEIKPNATVAYRLFPTQNVWTFIKLNTRTGQMWQVHYDVKENNRLQTDLYVVPLVSPENESNDRFTLYPTQNMYNFILLDQVDGKVWQVQWSMEIQNRMIVQIY